MSVEIDTVERLVAIMEKHGLRRIEAGGIVLERGEVITLPEKKGQKDDDPVAKRPIPPAGLGHYADEALWPEGEYPEELLSDARSERTMT